MGVGWVGESAVIEYPGANVSMAVCRGVAVDTEGPDGDVRVGGEAEDHTVSKRVFA